MIIRKLFVHIPKNAGMTIRRSPQLRDKIIICGPQAHKSPEYTQAVLEHMNKLGDHHGFEHARWRDLNPKLTQGHDAFAIIRNPWDRVVSRYFFAKKVIYHEPDSDHYGEEDYCNCSTFEEFLEERHKWAGMEFMGHRAIRGWYPALDHVTNAQGKIKCDIMRFENLNQDLCEYFRIPLMSGARNVTALNKGTYRDIYNDKTIQIVADWYKKDIDTFGFDFDTAATKNIWRMK